MRAAVAPSTSHFAFGRAPINRERLFVTRLAQLDQAFLLALARHIDATFRDCIDAEQSAGLFPRNSIGRLVRLSDVAARRFQAICRDSEFRRGNIEESI